MVWSTFHCCLWIRQEDVKVLLPWLFLEQFLSAFRITEKSKDQRKRHRETAHGKQNKTKQTHKPAKEQAFLTFIDQINSQKKTRKKKRKKTNNTVFLQ